MPEHMDIATNTSMMCYCNVLGFCPGNGSGSGCKFRHVVGSVFSQDFVVELCNQFDPDIRMIKSQGYLPGSNNRRANNRCGRSSRGDRGGRGGRWLGLKPAVAPWHIQGKEYGASYNKNRRSGE